MEEVLVTWIWLSLQLGKTHLSLSLTVLVDPSFGRTMRGNWVPSASGLSPHSSGFSSALMSLQRQSPVAALSGDPHPPHISLSKPLTLDKEHLLSFLLAYENFNKKVCIWEPCIVNTDAILYLSPSKWSLSRFPRFLISCCQIHLPEIYVPSCAMHLQKKHEHLPTLNVTTSLNFYFQLEYLLTPLNKLSTIYNPAFLFVSY